MLMLNRESIKTGGEGARRNTVIQSKTNQPVWQMWQNVGGEAESVDDDGWVV